jgi:hypothetical protein
MPLPDTGRPQGDIIARLFISGPDGLPSGQMAERSIVGDEWQRQAGKPLSIDFGVKLNRENTYIVVFSADGDKDNYRNLAVSGINRPAVTPCYGGGEALLLRDGDWRSLADGKESMFFATIANVGIQ